MDLPATAKENSIDLRRISDGTAKRLYAFQALKRPTMERSSRSHSNLLPHVTRVGNFLNGQRAAIP